MVPLQGDFIEAFHYKKELIRKTETLFFSRARSDRTRGNIFKLKDVRFRLHTRKTRHFLS